MVWNIYLGKVKKGELSQSFLREVKPLSILKIGPIDCLVTRVLRCNKLEIAKQKLEEGPQYSSAAKPDIPAADKQTSDSIGVFRQSYCSTENGDNVYNISTVILPKGA